MSELTKRDRAYIAAVEANTPKDFPNLVCGWPDDEYGDLAHGEYLEACCAIVDAIPDGEDVGTITFPMFKTWRRVVRERDEERGNLGFLHEECDVCGALPGHRYAATALPADPATNPDYLALSVCQDCLCYIANGDLPGED